MRLIISLGLIILLSSCASTSTNYYSKTVQSWNGGSASTLVKRWGNPDSKLLAANGYVAYVYRSESNHPNNARFSPSIGVNFTPGGKPILVSSPNTNRSLGNGMELSCVTVFVANKQGIITDTKMQGNRCYGNESFAENKANPIVTIEKSN